MGVYKLMCSSRAHTRRPHITLQQQKASKDCNLRSGTRQRLWCVCTVCLCTYKHHGLRRAAAASILLHLSEEREKEKEEGGKEASWLFSLFLSGEREQFDWFHSLLGRHQRTPRARVCGASSASSSSQTITAAAEDDDDQDEKIDMLQDGGVTKKYK